MKNEGQWLDEFRSVRVKEHQMRMNEPAIL